MRKMMSATIALWAGMAATTALAAEATPCVTEAEAQSVLLAIAPDAIRAVAQKCTSLPETATLRGGLATFLAPYDVAATGAWPLASQVLAKIAGPEMKGIDPATMRPMLTAMVGAMAADKVKPADCVMVERILTYIAPMPPANVAGLAIFAAASSPKGGKAPFSICPAATAAKPPASK